MSVLQYKAMSFYMKNALNNEDKSKFPLPMHHICIGSISLMHHLQKLLQIRTEYAIMTITAAAETEI